MQQISDLEPLQTEMFQLNYQKADAIKALISDKDGKFLSKRGTAVVDAAHQYPVRPGYRRRGSRKCAG